MARNNWTRPQQVAALELYLRTPFGRIHNRNPDIIALATTIGRTTDAVAMKMSNFAALDPSLSQKGLSKYSRSDAELWVEFFDAPSSFIELSAFSGEIYKQHSEEPNPSYEVREGSDSFRTAKTRVGQTYFRKMIMASYDGQCGLTNIAQSKLLIASHIVPWSDRAETRLDPRNGILLNSLHDRAFDNGYITFEDDLTMVKSKSFQLPQDAQPFFSDRKLRAPRRFLPDPAFLQYHRDAIFDKKFR